MSKRTILSFVLLIFVLLVACASPTTVPTPAPRSTQAVAATVVAPTTNAPATAAPNTPPPVATNTTLPGIVSVTILHTNDMHGYLEGEKLQGSGGVEFEWGGILHAFGNIVRLKQEANHQTIILDNGDFWQGTFASNRDQGKTIVAGMNLIGYDALTLGNHDFDHGLAVIQARAREAQFPFLAANMIEPATGKTPAWLKPYTIKQIAGFKFGIIGLTNTGTPGISSHAKELRVYNFVNEIETLKKILPEVKSQADFIIVVSHNGIDRETALAQAVPGIDVLVSGHTHTPQMNPKLVNGAILVHAGYKAQYVGRLELLIDSKTKKIVDYTKQNAPITAVSNKSTPPKQLSEMFLKLIEEGRVATRQVIGETQVDLTRVFTADGRSTGEYPSGNLVVDAMLAANQAGDKPAELALHNNAGIRADIPKGPLTYGKLYEMLPFDNVLTAMDLTGAQIKAILEQATSCPRVNILVAGMSFEYDCTKRQGSRASNIRIQGQPLDMQRTYRVQTINYLAGGGDGQATFTQGTNLVYGDPVIDVVVAYVKQNSPIAPKVEGRIVEARTR